MRGVRRSVEFAGFSGETLHGALQEPLDRVRSGRDSPQSVRLRILIPDTSEPLALHATQRLSPTTRCFARGPLRSPAGI